MNNTIFHKAIENAIIEDIGNGDHSSLACIPKDAIGKAQLLIKQKGIVAGVEIAQKVFQKIDNTLIFNQNLEDGCPVKFGDIVFTIEGKIQSILKSERLVLNIMQRMSGIATETSLYVQKLNGTNTKILDTRKTTPNFRYFEKLAVKIGGGENHRMGLYDMVMLKDNHIDFAGGIENAITRTKDYLKNNNKDLKIEIEVRTLDDIQKVLNAGGVDRIMFDNFSVELTYKAVEMIGDKMETESSGGITIENIAEYAKTGVGFISVGALTHQIKSLDMSLKAINY